MITSFFKPKRDRAAGNENGTELDAFTAKVTGTSKKRKTTLSQHEAITKSQQQRQQQPPPPPAKRTPAVAGSSDASELMRYLNDPSENSSSSSVSSSSSFDPESSWKVALAGHFASPSFGRLASFVGRERTQKTVYPPVEDTFAALNLCPLSETKLVIVGQDPYHGPHQAHGLCFSVRKGIPVPPSLKNIYKELLQDTEIPGFDKMPSHGNLERWAKQGVLMINNVLTVRRGEAHSHKKRGWEQFTDEIIRAVDQRTRRDAKRNRNHTTGNGNDKNGNIKSNGTGVVFLLWGRPATEKAKTALAGISSRHRIICTSHPSPLGATKTKAPFLGSRCFSRANKALLELGYNETIDWRVDGAVPGASAMNSNDSGRTN
eukprot:CAMPEP_0172368892 /NCGR_PEP_ID=MMETSP1060-20121228/29625_1 /TAXON_ID=37318 /ORGANISM="Pseudo-nitzschia pungens, Strain cf. cingulata" /LENGTH=374 /DNA_ID=CAMNT_0013093631 /DNA_START=361 /DNA_END=1485 /DNA_ORIENTATION=+